MGYSGLIFNSVTSFVLQPQKTKQIVKRNDLDKLLEVYVGPAGGEDAFIPQIGAHHHQYNLMRFIGAETRQMPGLVVEVSLHYQGKLIHSGSGTYTSVPTINRYFLDGEISYQEGQYTYSLRYTGRCVQMSFITNLVPNGNPTYLGLAKGYSGIENQWSMVTEDNLSIPASGETIKTGLPYERMDCTDVRIEDDADGWYKITETYQTRMYPGMIFHSPPPPQISAGNHLISAPESTQQADTQQAATKAAESQDGVHIPITYPKDSQGNIDYTNPEYVNADVITNFGMSPDSSSDGQTAGSAAASDWTSQDSFSQTWSFLGAGTTMLPVKGSISSKLTF
jgi:hypothetical protein